MRPSKVRVVERISGSIGADPSSAVAGRSIGRLTSENADGRLRLAVLEDLEVVGGEVADERAARVGHDGVHLHEGGLGPEGDSRLGCGARLLLCRGLAHASRGNECDDHKAAHDRVRPARGDRAPGAAGTKEIIS